jgi:F0F1-type ATP synthase membrane subunit c/vacuolar-type H+-ATPase subunit K
MEQNATEFTKSTQKQALYLWAGLSLALTLFFVQSQLVFVRTEPLPSSSLEWVFSGMGVATFLLGLVFFKNYLALRKKALLRMPFKDRKQSILIAFVLQFVLFETLGLYGVLLSVLTQSTMKAIPFLLFAYLGFYLSFPKEKKVAPFFENKF